METGGLDARLRLVAARLDDKAELDRLAGVIESDAAAVQSKISTQEIREAIRRLVTAHYGGTLDQLTTGAARLFGFNVRIPI